MPNDNNANASANPLWYKEAVIYEMHVRSFADGDGDGVGDFQGAISRLDYLEKLGVTAVWLLPFYPSPLRDDGYDIADYKTINPAYGNLSEFKRFLREAHARGIRVITELVLNHTSDQHPWFQRARKAQPGSAHRDFYVWSDTSEKFRKARIIFSDFEHSNWTWDPVAKAYYWHRFYSHQPDLNFDNPAVRQAMLKVVDHWLALGVDGLRLDAVPYLYERQGTDCENLPETHAFLKELRAHVDANYPGRMLLAEANQWPEEAVNYFGRGDECHMAFHFPVMPRLFMALWMEDRHPIIDILEQTPAIPETCQWAIFLRNHDELTLEMVSDEERDYMYRAYARDAKSRINLGIRRRLAPLMQNNRRKMELLNFLLFSFPATPIIYYGDELGMGDNYHLGDRNGVRTPMQWSPDRNAGFSRANPQSLFLPVIIDPEYHYEVVNVETAEHNPSSFLWWMRRLISAYKRLPALGRGGLEFVRGGNAKVLSFVRAHGEDRILVVVNLSRFAQVAELDLSGVAGLTPVEVFGRTRFPVIRTEPYVLTLGPHDHFWFRLEDAERATPDPESVRPLFSFRLDGRDCSEAACGLAPDSLAAFFSGNGVTRGGAPFRDLALIDRLGLDAPVRPAHLILTESARGQSAPETQLFLIRQDDQGTGLADGFRDPEAIQAFLEHLAAPRKRGEEPPCFLSDLHVPRRQLREMVQAAPPVRLIKETRHTVTCAAGEAIFLKFYLHPEEGRHPEAEMLDALEREDFPGAPRLLARLGYRRRSGEDMTLALAMTCFPGLENGETFVTGALERFFERVMAGAAPPVRTPAPDILSEPDLRPEQRDMVGDYILDFFRRLGQRTAELHLTLRRTSSPAFAPEPFSKLYQRSLYQAMRNLNHRVTTGLAGRRPDIPNRVLLDRFSRLLKAGPGGLRIRVHGDFQLDNVLFGGKELPLVDFDGDARLLLGERRLKRSALRDVADLILSVAVVSERAARRRLALSPSDGPILRPWLSLWLDAVCRAFSSAYLAQARTSDFLPGDETTLLNLVEIFLFERMLRKIALELEGDGAHLELYTDILNGLARILP